MPRAPKQCGKQACTTLVVGRTYCDAHTNEHQRITGWGRGSTRQSRKDRLIVLQRDPTCYLQYQGCTTVSTEDDHVTPRGQGGSNSLSNRRGACHNCHLIKSKRESHIRGG